jgi:hypothetical protein
VVGLIDLFGRWCRSEETMKYLIAHIGHTLKSHEHVCWWNPDSCGYTICIDKAGRYSGDEARSICKDPRCIAVLVQHVEPLARTTPYFRRSDGSVNKLYDGGPHRPVPNELAAWKQLLAARLAGCAHPIKPTPISGTKARAIYLDAVPA